VLVNNTPASAPSDSEGEENGENEMEDEERENVRYFINSPICFKAHKREGQLELFIIS